VVESTPLRRRLRADLTDSQSVTITAIGLGVTAFVLVSLDGSPVPASADFGAEFLLSLSLMDMAFIYDDYWPVEYGPTNAVVWALLFGVVTALVFFGVYDVGLSHVERTAASIVAFLMAVGVQFGSAVLYACVR
jgi:hypothetical protein